MCKARQYSDQMICGRCALAWDMNDPDPPECLKRPHSPVTLTNEEIETMTAEQQQTETETWYFTFGIGHAFEGHYATVTIHGLLSAAFEVGAGEGLARETMHKYYADKWAFHYPSLPNAEKPFRLLSEMTCNSDGDMTHELRI